MEKKPRIIEGICEYCGIEATKCRHFSIAQQDKQVFGGDRSSKEYYTVTEKLADLIIPHHTNHSDLKNLLEMIDVSLFNIIVCSGQSFGKNCNKGSRVAETDKIIFLNDDIEISNEQLIKIVNALDDYDFVGSTQLAGIENPLKYWGIGLFKSSDGNIFHRICLEKEKTIFPSGFLFGMKKKVWQSSGGFDERFRTGNEDVDFGLKMLAIGAKMRMLDLEVKHKESQSVGRFKYCKENEKLIYSLWSQETLREIYNSYYENFSSLPDDDIDLRQSNV